MSLIHRASKLLNNQKEQKRDETETENTDTVAKDPGAPGAAADLSTHQPHDAFDDISEDALFEANPEENEAGSVPLQDEPVTATTQAQPHKEPETARDAGTDTDTETAVAAAASKTDAKPPRSVPPPPRKQQTTGTRNTPPAPPKVGSSNRITIDLERLADLGFVTPRTRRRKIAEEVRLIKRRLLREMPSLGDPSLAQPGSVENVIMTTSSRPDEGKTFVAINLAMSFAVDEGLDVLLIDADVSNPSVIDILDLPDEGPGLIDLLTDSNIDMPECLQRDERLRLSVMGVGTRVASATELFGSKLMQEFVVHVTQRHPDRVIIFDAPPVLASTEPMVLAQAMGHVLLVVAANKTQKETVKSAVDMLDPAENVKVVLNRAAPYGAGEFGNYYYDFD